MSGLFDNICGSSILKRRLLGNPYIRGHMDFMEKNGTEEDRRRYSLRMTDVCDNMNRNFRDMFFVCYRASSEEVMKVCLETGLDYRLVMQDKKSGFSYLQAMISPAEEVRVSGEVPVIKCDFSACSEMKSTSFDEGVKQILICQFPKFSRLEKAYISSSVEVVNPSVFKECPKMSECFFQSACTAVFRRGVLNPEWDFDSVMSAEQIEILRSNAAGSPQIL